MTSSEQLPIIYQDEHLIVVNKPSGLLVHRSMIDKRETRFAMQILRDQVGAHVFPVHRIDKATSGVLLFAMNRDMARILSMAFEQRKVKKEYLAVVRGYVQDSGEIDHPLKEKLSKYTDSRVDPNKEAQQAFTRYERLKQVELDIPVAPHNTSRYSYVRLFPGTGRKHQLRRHMKHICHPIVGDTSYGRSEHNQMFRDHFSCNRLLLHAEMLDFTHPATGELIVARASHDQVFSQILGGFGWS